MGGSVSASELDDGRAGATIGFGIGDGVMDGVVDGVSGEGS